MARRINTLNAVIWIGIALLVVAVWTLAIIGAICLWSGDRDDAMLRPAFGNGAIEEFA